MFVKIVEKTASIRHFFDAGEIHFPICATSNANGDQSASKVPPLCAFQIFLVHIGRPVPVLLNTMGLRVVKTHLQRFVGRRHCVVPGEAPRPDDSGVLVDAITAGLPVIATAFPHAVELLSSGAGIVVPRRDPKALADAIRTALTTPGKVNAMASEARRLAPELAWPTIESRYAALGENLLNNRALLSVNQ